MLPYRHALRSHIARSSFCAVKRTIYALSTPPGKAGVAVIRISGPDALEVWRRMVSTRNSKKGKGKARYCDPEPWKMHMCKIIHPDTEELLDEGLAVFLKLRTLNAISCIPFCRPAERGEFTRRAFEGGRLDLTQVEGLKDLIDAETEVQRRVALRTAGGAARSRFGQLRTEIIQCLALIEALIDFGEGEDIEEGVYDQARERVLNLQRTIRNHLSDNRRGEIMRSGLLNYLAQREAAIVTPVPGTTRDILELSLDVAGLPVIVADTAGLRKTDDIVEKIGVERAKQLVESSDVSLCVLALPEILKSHDGAKFSLDIPSSVSSLLTSNTFVLLNKADLATSALSEINLSDLGVQHAWMVSLGTGHGTQTFLEGFGKALQQRYNILQEQGSDLDEPLITHARHRIHLENTVQFLQAFLDTPPEDVVFGAEELHYAAQAVGKVSG
ncbi:tRNA modification GTPase GTPBP3, mitochondrial [Grifola frondosa]|uniref:tRNA modification GTPase GTPBP3, mitochondrial n=1 Tax=Grifola frondosa TaxID=5627 RepID=A0A1C7M604_GRIFR|nr:tRNA modification GTPase GTPBP3, mitochondrial [Grifola frondosa]